MKDRTDLEQATLILALNKGLATHLNAATVADRSVFSTVLGVSPNGNRQITITHTLVNGDTNVYTAGWQWSSDGDRVTISPVIDHNELRYGESKPTATIRDDRGPKALASALLKRVLPDAEPLFDRVRERVAAHTRYTDQRAANAARLGKAIGHEFTPDAYRGADSDPRLSFYGLDADISGDATVTGSYLKLDVSIEDMDLAEAVLKVIRNHAKRQRTDVAKV